MKKQTEQNNKTKNSKKEVSMSKVSEVEIIPNNKLNKSTEVVMKSVKADSNSSLTNSITNNSEVNMKSSKSKSSSASKDSQMDPTVEQAVYSGPSTTPTSRPDSEISYRRADARKTASIRNVRLLKKTKFNNTLKQLRDTRAILKRGYYIIRKEAMPGDPNSVITIHQALDEAEREFIRRKRQQLRYDLLILQNEIGEYSSDLKSMSYRTKMSINGKYAKTLSDVNIKKSVRKIVNTIDKQILKDSQNGQRDFLKGIQEDPNEVNQKIMLSTYIGKILTPNQQKVLILPQAQEVIIRRSLNSVKQLEM